MLLLGVIRAAVLAALARGADTGDDGDARAGARRADPLVRRAARRQLERAIAEAEAEAGAGGATDRAHVYRVAYLRAAGRLPADVAADRDAVRSRFARARPRSARLVWWATGGTAALALAAVAAAFALATASRPPPRAGADLRRIPALDAALSGDLSAFVTALDARTRGAAEAGRVDRARARLLERTAAHLSGDAQAALRRVTAVAEALPRAPAGARDRRSRELVGAVAELDRALTRAGLAYHLTAYVADAGGRPVILLPSYTVLGNRRYTSRGEPLEVLRVRRLAELNVRLAVQGLATGDGHALVLLGEVEAGIVAGALRLAAGAPLAERARPAVSGAARYRELCRRVSRTARGALAALAPPGDVDALAGVLARRRTLVRSWQSRLAGRGLAITLPRGLELGWRDRGSLAQLVPAKELDELDRLQARLGSPRLASAFARVREAAARHAEIHELQHVLDGRGELPTPPALAALAPGGDTARARDELSARLAALARARSATARLWLAREVAILARSDERGRAETRAVAVMLDGLAAAAGLGGSAIADGRRVVAGRAVPRALALLELPAPDLRQAARRAWERLFGRSLAPLEVVRSRAGAPAGE